MKLFSRVLRRLSRQVFWLSVAFLGFFGGALAQQAGSGNTYIGAGTTAVVFGAHTFVGGIATDRSSNYGRLGFASGSSWSGASASALVDGYVTLPAGGSFVLPLGSASSYRPLAIQGASAAFTAAYYALSAGASGGAPGSPFAVSSLSPGLSAVSTAEYWHVPSGSGSATLTLTWAASSNIASLTSNDLTQLRIAGWNASASRWELIASAANSAALSTGSSTPAFSGGSSGLSAGSITSSSAVSLSAYSAFTFGVPVPHVYWDGPNTSSNNTVDGGSATWDTSTTNWTLVGGNSNNTWAGGSNIAIFQGAAGTVTVSGTPSVGGLTFNVDGYGLTGGKLTLAGTANPITVTNASDSATIGSELTGSNNLAKAGAGTLTLSGANTYTGTTTISAGRLNINGNQSSASGTLTVQSGGTLGGSSGTVGGAVTVQSGGTLSTGSASTASIGNLAIRGNLTLQSGAGTVVDLAQAGSAGGSCNDLATVSGNLTLGGILTVRKADSLGCGNVFGAGTYTLFTYTGSLSGSYSSLSLPTGYLGVIDTTSQPGSVLLVVQLADFRYWDEATNTPANANNSVVDGGTGIWDGTRSNWTTPSGVINNAWGGGAKVAVFEGTAGTVTVSGAQSLGGLSFNTNGYILDGSGPLTPSALSNNPFTVDAGLTATVATPLAGSAAFVKEGSGTLILSGNSSTYSGDIHVSTGVLKVTGNSGTGAITVQSGATLGGTGTVGGAAAIQPGATLNPDLGLTPATLSVNGNLQLNNGSLSKFALGQAGTAGGSCNDLLAVSGSLTLSGSLSVTASAGGGCASAFGVGIYTLFTYTGALSGSFDSVTVPTGYAGSVDTSIAGQVRLIVMLAGVSITGKVFNDGGAPSGGNNTGTPNNGIQDGSESGLASVTVSLTNCGSTTHASATTDAKGAYSLSLPNALQGQGVCVAATVAKGYLATGANVGGTVTPDGAATAVSGVSYTYTRSQHRQSFTAPLGGSLTLNFGLVPVSTLVNNGSAAAMQGTFASHSHRFTAGTGGSLSLSSLTGAASPETVTGWTETLYLDTACSGTLASGATPLSGTMAVVQGQVVCFVMRQFVPGTAVSGNSYSVPLQAQLTFTNATPALIASYTVTDATNVSNTALQLQKQVRNLTAGGANAAWSTNNNANRGDQLEYRVTFTNASAAPLTEVVVQDGTTYWTTWQSATVESLPSGLSCTVNTPANPAPAAGQACSPAVTGSGKGNLTWTLTGTLQPAASGSVTYKVTVD